MAQKLELVLRDHFNHKFSSVKGFLIIFAHC